MKERYNDLNQNFIKEMQEFVNIYCKYINIFPLFFVLKLNSFRAEDTMKTLQKFNMYPYNFFL